MLLIKKALFVLLAAGLGGGLAGCRSHSHDDLGDKIEDVGDEIEDVFD